MKSKMLQEYNKISGTKNKIHVKFRDENNNLTKKL